VLCRLQYKSKTAIERLCVVADLFVANLLLLDTHRHDGGVCEETAFLCVCCPGGLLEGTRVGIALIFAFASTTALVLSSTCC